ncbi:hypothetical protein FB451DRAFT_1553881 [Mycena latifolia]|nr:hypothetical protein FB451DRAFT_1553881 [Mycena latifolia]
MSALAQEVLSETKEENDQRMPPELVELILGHLRYDPETLRRAALVSTEWLPIARAYLFARISLPAPESGTTRTACSALYAVLSKSPHIARYIQHVTITGPYWIQFPTSRNWIFTDETLPLLLDILLASSRAQSFHMHLVDQPWGELPMPLQTATQSLVNLPTMLAVDFTAVAALDVAIFKDCRALKRLKFSGIEHISHRASDSPADAWPARCDSLTVLDINTEDLADIVSWAISTPTFHALRDLRLGFEPNADVSHVQALLSLVSGALETLHLQPHYNSRPIENVLDISALRMLRTLRLSLWLATISTALPWATTLLCTPRLVHVKHLTIDLRISECDPAVFALPWAALDDVLCALGLRSLALTCFASDPESFTVLDTWPEPVKWLKDELSHLLPRAHAYAVFESRAIGGSLVSRRVVYVYSQHIVEVTRTRFVYWPGPLSWGHSLGIEDQN